MKSSLSPLNLLDSIRFVLFQHDDSEHGRAMNISGAWRLDFTGKNVVVTILDDGIEKNHHDLVQNYVSVSVLTSVSVDACLRRQQ